MSATTIRRILLGTMLPAALALTAAEFASAAETPARHPNVVLVMTDDQGYGDLGCHGNPIVKTPHLDKMHAESVRLTNYHVDPTCSPTRSALMTGRNSGRVYWPGGGLTGGRNVDRLTVHMDMLPTLIELCGLKRPEGVEFDGTSIARLLTGDEGDWPDRALVVESQRIEHPQKWRKSAVMTDRWRLVNGKELYDVRADPAQKENVAAEHGEVVRRLADHYEKWWQGVSRRHGEYCRIVLGNEAENPATLTGHDWHEGSPPWNQSHIRSGSKVGGFWAVEVELPGQYEIELRRWPREAKVPISEGPGVKAVQARLRFAEVDVTQPVPEGAMAVTFKVTLPAGKTRLQSWLIDEQGNSRGAYYAYVKRVE